MPTMRTTVCSQPAVAQINCRAGATVEPGELAMTLCAAGVRPIYLAGFTNSHRNGHIINDLEFRTNVLRLRHSAVQVPRTHTRTHCGYIRVKAQSLTSMAILG